MLWCRLKSSNQQSPHLTTRPFGEFDNFVTGLFSPLLFQPNSGESSSEVVVDKDLSVTEDQVIEQQSAAKESPPSIFDLLGVSPTDIESDEVSAEATSVSDLPSLVPTLAPIDVPIPLIDITFPPTTSPAVITTVVITFDPTNTPTNSPSDRPSDTPSEMPSDIPTVLPSMYPSAAPSDPPSQQPSSVPSSPPSTLPTLSPSISPSTDPTAITTVFIPFVAAPSDTERDATGSMMDESMLSDIPSDAPSTFPSSEPTALPSDVPSEVPSVVPTAITTVFIPFVQAPTTSAEQPDAEASMEEIMESDFPSISPKTFDEPTDTIPNMVSSEASLPSMVQVSELDSATDIPSDMPSDIPSDMPSDMPSHGFSDAPSTVPAGDNLAKDTLPSDFPSTAPSSSSNLVSTKFMDAEHIEIFEDVCANDFLREFLPWVQSADYKVVTCSVISQKETASNRRRMQTDEHRAQITYRTNGIDVLILVFGMVDLPQGVSFQSVVLKTFVNFKSEFQEYLSSASSFFLDPESSDETTSAVSEGVTESENDRNILGATTVWYIVAAALIAGGFLALALSFFILSRREDDDSMRMSRDGKDDASSRQLSPKRSEDDMLPPTPVGLDAMRPAALDTAESEGDGGDDNSSEPSPTMLSEVSFSRETGYFDQIIGKYSPHAGKREIPDPSPPSPRLSFIAEECLTKDIESQDQSHPEISIVEPWTAGWRRILSFGKRKRSMEIPPLQQQRSSQGVSTPDLAGWKQGSLEKQRVFDHVLTDLDKLEKKKSTASTPKHDNTSTKPTW